MKYAAGRAGGYGREVMSSETASEHNDIGRACRRARTRHRTRGGFSDATCTSGEGTARGAVCARLHGWVARMLSDVPFSSGRGNLTRRRRLGDRIISPRGAKTAWYEKRRAATHELTALSRSQNATLASGISGKGAARAGIPAADQPTQGARRKNESDESV
jgi:hypothetical protein